MGVCPHCKKGTLFKRNFGLYMSGKLQSTYDCGTCGKVWVTDEHGNLKEEA